jgi:hypothetical protein
LRCVGGDVGVGVGGGGVGGGGERSEGGLHACVKEFEPHPNVLLSFWKPRSVAPYSIQTSSVVNFSPCHRASLLGLDDFSPGPERVRL